MFKIIFKFFQCLVILYYLVGHTVIYYVLVVTYTGYTRALCSRNIDFPPSVPTTHFDFSFLTLIIFGEPIVYKTLQHSHLPSFCSQTCYFTRNKQTSKCLLFILQTEFVIVLLNTLTYIFSYCDMVSDESCVFFRFNVFLYYANFSNGKHPRD